MEFPVTAAVRVVVSPKSSAVDEAERTTEASGDRTWSMVRTGRDIWLVASVTRSVTLYMPVLLGEQVSSGTSAERQPGGRPDQV